MSHIREELTRKLAANPDLVDSIHPILEHIAKNQPQKISSRRKQSTKRSTWLLVEWAMLRNKSLSESEVCRFFKSEFGWSPEWQSDQSEIRWDVGDRVEVDLNNCDNPTILGSLNPEGEGKFHGEKGVITETENTKSSLGNGRGDFGDIEIDLDSGASLYVEEGQQKQKSGLLTPGTESIVTSGNPVVEFVYLSQTSYTPDEEAISQTQEYVQQDKNRRSNYYAGNPSRPKEGDDGDIYINMDLDDPRQWRTITPNKGKVLYVGTPKKRPFGERELEERVNRFLRKKGEDPKY